LKANDLISLGGEGEGERWRSAGGFALQTPAILLTRIVSVTKLSKRANFKLVRLLV